MDGYLMAHQMTLNKLIAGLFLSCLCFVNAWAEGSAKKGADTFAEECGDCHSASGKNKKGPSLIGVNGRKAGSVAEYAGYSDAMKDSGIVWNADKLDAYISHPKKVVVGGKMKYEGLSDSKSRADIIAFVLSMK
jgi:cytochrome c